jgi:hypothetical protein
MAAHPASNYPMQMCNGNWINADPLPATSSLRGEKKTGLSFYQESLRDKRPARRFACSSGIGRWIRVPTRTYAGHPGLDTRIIQREFDIKALMITEEAADSPVD